MHYEIVTVTPELAKEWLQVAKINRKIRPGYIEFLRKEIEQGRWEFTAEAIRFDVNGDLIDGQHRLNAIIQANSPVTLLIVRGLSPKVFYKIDTGMNRTLADTTGVPAKLVQIYSVLLDVSRGSGLRKSSNDILVMHQYLGAIALSLLQHSGANRKFYGAAPMRAAAVLSIKAGQPKDYVLALYKNLVAHQYSNIPPIAEVLTRQYEDNRIRLGKYRAGESSSRVAVFLLGMYIYDESNRDRKQLLIERKRDHYLDLCRHIVTETLSIDVPHLGAESAEKKYKRTLRENTKLREALVQKREIDDQGD